MVCVLGLSEAMAAYPEFLECFLEYLQNELTFNMREGYIDPDVSTQSYCLLSPFALLVSVVLYHINIVIVYFLAL